MGNQVDSRLNYDETARAAKLSNQTLSLSLIVLQDDSFWCEPKGPIRGRMELIRVKWQQADGLVKGLNDGYKTFNIGDSRNRFRGKSKPC